MNTGDFQFYFFNAEILKPYWLFKGNSQEICDLLGRMLSLSNKPFRWGKQSKMKCMNCFLSFGTSVTLVTILILNNLVNDACITLFIKCDYFTSNSLVWIKIYQTHTKKTLCNSVQCFPSNRCILTSLSSQ